MNKPFNWRRCILAVTITGVMLAGVSCSAAIKKPASAAKPETAVIYDGSKYATAASAEQFVSGALKGQYLTWDFKADDFSKAAISLINVCKEKKIRPGDVFDPSKWICRKCSYELPASFPFSLLISSRTIIGDYDEGVSQKDVEQFKKTKQCPKCGNKVFCYITEPPARSDITKEDILNIRKYFKYLASIWWQGRSGSKICDKCNKSVSEGDGYIYGIIISGQLRAYRLYCNTCMDDMLNAPSLLPNLQKNPDYMGRDLIKKAREYAEGKR